MPISEFSANKLKAQAKQTSKLLQHIFSNESKQKRQRSAKLVEDAARKAIYDHTINGSANISILTRIVRLNSKQMENIISRLSHELSHAGHFGNNNYVTANAIGTFIEGLEMQNIYYLKSKQNPLPQRQQANSFSVSTIVDIGLENALMHACSKKGMAGLRVEGGQSNDRYYHIEHTTARRYPKNGRKFTFSQLGNELGRIALAIELKHPVRGVGLIVIREVTVGKPISEVITKAKNGEYDSQAKEIMGNNPILKRWPIRGAQFFEKYFTDNVKLIDHSDFLD